MGGIFQRNRQKNPLWDANIMYLPYCSSDAVRATPLHPALPGPYPALPGPTHAYPRLPISVTCSPYHNRSGWATRHPALPGPYPAPTHLCAFLSSPPPLLSAVGG